MPCHVKLFKFHACFVYSEDVFSSYACNSLNHKGIKHHPGDIVEAGCLAVSMYTTCFLKWLENQTKFVPSVVKQALDLVSV